MITEGKRPDKPQKRDRFLIHDDEIEITGRRFPSPEERREADRVFDRILKNRKPKKD